MQAWLVQLCICVQDLNSVYEPDIIYIAFDISETRDLSQNSLEYIRSLTSQNSCL